MDSLLYYNYFVLLGLLVLNSVLALLKKNSIIRISGLFAFASAVFSFVGVFLATNHLPASDGFEKLQNVILILTGIGMTYNVFIPKAKVSQSFWLVALFLQLYILTGPLKASAYFYMYDNQWVVAFFQLRITSIALFSYALSLYLTYIVSGDDKEGILMQRGRNFMLLAAGIFLAGEFSGSVWAQLGWGDAWRWSKGFFLSNIFDNSIKSLNLK